MKLARGCALTLFACMILIVLVQLLPPATPRNFGDPAPTQPRESASATPLPATARVTQAPSPTPAAEIDPAVLATQNYFTDLMTQVFVTQQGTPVTALPSAVVATAVPQAVIYEVDDALYFAQGSVNVRACPSTECELVGPLLNGESVLVTGQAPGEAVRGVNNVWYRVTYAGREAFVYSEFVTNVRATAVPPTRAPVQQAPVSTRPRPSSPFTCDGRDNLNCDSFNGYPDGSDQAHLEMCGNEDRLDGDGDGWACEFTGW